MGRSFFKNTISLFISLPLYHNSRFYRCLSPCLTLCRPFSSGRKPVALLLLNFKIDSHLYFFTMPYILISTQIRMECGPTMVGDGESDPKLMEKLEAKLTKQLGNEFQEYITKWSPRKVLNQLEKEGWKMVAMAGIGQTCAWTLYKEEAF